MTVPEAPKQQFFSGKRYIAPEKDTPMLPISFTHWERLRERVKKVGEPPADRLEYEALAWGMAIPSGGSLLVYLVGNRNPWAIAVYGCLTGFALLFGWTVRRFRHDADAVRTANCADICAEMDAHKVAYEEEEKSAA
jgi:hypothetical protein